MYNKDHWSAVHWACASGRQEVMKQLLLNGGNPHAKTKKGETPLHFAAAKGDHIMVKILAALGVDLQVANVEGNQALQLAAEAGFAEVVKVLLDKGVDKNTANNARSTGTISQKYKKNVIGSGQKRGQQMSALPVPILKNTLYSDFYIVNVPDN
jgi:ankyrin repeat protein